MLLGELTFDLPSFKIASFLNDPTPVIPFNPVQPDAAHRLEGSSQRRAFSPDMGIHRKSGFLRRTSASPPIRLTQNSFSAIMQLAASESDLWIRRAPLGWGGRLFLQSTDFLPIVALAGVLPSATPVASSCDIGGTCPASR
jgi:hypothetical protein